MDYIRLEIDCLDEWKDIHIAHLADAGYESFEEEPGGIRAFIAEKDFDPGQLEHLTEGTVYRLVKIPSKNWNEEWEQNFSPVEINERCRIRAPFHEKVADCPYELVIQPKMSFGTGHHSTTRLVIETMFELPFKGSKVLDYGTGTGILAILAMKLEATAVWAIDHNEWAYDNALENFALNELQMCSLRTGELSEEPEADFDIILANINKNVILDNLSLMADKLKPGGTLCCSGFFETDVTDLTKAAEECRLKYINLKTHNGWAMALYQK